MSLMDDIDAEFATETATATETEEGKNDTSEEVEEKPEGENESEEGEEKPEGEETEEKKEPEKVEKPKNGVQKRIDELTRRNYELQRQLQEATKQTPKRQMPEAPDPRNFQTLNDFNIAKAKYETAVEFTKQQIADEEAREQETVQRSIAEKIQAEKGKYQDFDTVVRNVSDIALSDDVMYGLVLNDPNGVDTLYWLGQHRARAEEISRLKPAEQALALGRISANIKAQQKGKQVSGAPKPPSKVGGNGGAAMPDLKKMSGDEYIAWRKKQEASKNKKR